MPTDSSVREKQMSSNDRTKELSTGWIESVDNFFVGLDFPIERR